MIRKVFSIRAFVLVIITAIALQTRTQINDDPPPAVSPDGERVLSHSDRSGDDGKPNVAILVFEGVQIIDFAAPYEVFGQYGLNNVYTVAENTSPITTNMGMRMEPSYTIDDHPDPDLIVIPGGRIGEQRKNPRLREWLEKNVASAQHVLSVCNGAFYLADAGLLDGLEATTFFALLDDLQEDAPKAIVVDDRRFADNGKIVTSAGLSSAIDGSLHVLSKMHGRAWARVVALNLEYDWNPQTDFARPLLADMNIPSSVYSVVMPEGRFAAYDGDRDQWTMSWIIPAHEASSSVLARIEDKLEAESWNRVPEGGVAGEWAFIGRDGLTWRGHVDVRPRQDSLLVDFIVEREMRTR